MGTAWLNSSPSIPLTPGCVRERYLNALDRLQGSTTTSKCCTPTPSSSGLPSRGGEDSSRSGGIRDLQARLEFLAFTPRGENAPPLVTYQTTPGPYGDVVSATPEFIRWFRRTYPTPGRASRAGLEAPCPPNKGVGRAAPGADLIF